MISKDALKIRRRFAIYVAVYAFVVWPNLLIVYNLHLSLSEGLVDKMLLYIGTLAAGPMGAYFWAANRQQKANIQRMPVEEKDDPEQIVQQGE